ncbi:unnamed protein product [Caenorhabditis auriculariae]|uniref:Uncharacterized protein n=1 Tax=Caenorhabditis auriculariae TaxID=2777116 RepID=A0A8S1H274_9PELO|nr:unnamed protein product [Caenorhabditis auriculariae]
MEEERDCTRDSELGSYFTTTEPRVSFGFTTSFRPDFTASMAQALKIRTTLEKMNVTGSNPKRLHPLFNSPSNFLRDSLPNLQLLRSNASEPHPAQ